MYNMEQDKEFAQLNMQQHSLTGICPPSQPQEQLHQSIIPIQVSRQHNEYTPQNPHPQSLTNNQQQMEYSNGIMAPFHYNMGNVPAFYPSNDLVTPIHPQQGHQPLQMNTNTQSSQQQPQQQHRFDSRMRTSTRLSDEDDEHYTTDQFKMMTSKERRQLRNKVSARNFRNRRKEYITSLEEQVETFKNENSQLQLEINWVRTTMNKLQNENDDLRVKLALCRGGITTKQESTLSDRHSSQGQQQQQRASPPTATATIASVPQPQPLPSSPSLPLQSDCSPSVQPTSTTTDTNSSQNPVISTSALAQNGNSSFTLPDLHGSSHHQPAIQQQQHNAPSPPNSLNLTQQSASICPRENNEKLNPSTLATTTSPSLPGSNLESVDATHFGSSSCHPDHLASSYTDFTVSTNAWDMVLPATQVPLTCPLDPTMTQQLLVPPLVENTGSFYSIMESQQTPMATNQQHLTSTHTHHHQSGHVQQLQQHHQQTSSPRSQPSHQQQLEHNTLGNRTNNNRNVSTAVFPDVDFGTALEKQQEQVGDGNILWKYPLLVPALLSIIIDHTMTMTTDELLSHAQLLSTPTPDQRLLSTFSGSGNRPKPYLGTGSMTPGLRYPPLQPNRSSFLTDTYPLSKKQLDALWEHLLDQMATTQPPPPSQATTVVENGNKVTNDDDDESPATLWYETPVTGFKSICPLYWMQRQLCRFVITYVIVKYPQLEIPCKTYLPICEQFRRRLVTTPF